MEGFPAKILLATDGSEDAALAARAAADLSERAGSELHIVHVLPRFPRYAYPGVTPQIYSRVLDEALRGARDLLEEQVSCLVISSMEACPTSSSAMDSARSFSRSRASAHRPTASPS